MNCPDYAEWIAHKLDGSLSERRTKELDVHLSVCGRCRAELLLQKKIHETLARELPSGLAPDFAEQVAEKVLRDSAAEKRAERWANLVPVFAFAAGAILLIAFRSDLARIIPGLMEPMASALASPVAWIGDAILGFLAHLTDLPAEQLSALEVLSRPLMITVTTTLLGVIPTIWAFYRISSFLRE